MISFTQFINEEIANSTGDGIANPDTVMSLRKRDDFMGYKVFEVEHEDYCNCMNGKAKGDRWNKYFANDEDSKVLKKEFYKQKPVLIQDRLTKGLVFLRK